MASRNYDKDDVLKYVYGELPPSEEGDFVEAMCADEELFSYYKELKDIHSDLEESREEIEEEYEPSEFSVHQVLSYVRQSGPSHPPIQQPIPRKEIRRMRITGLAMVAVTALFVIFTVFIYQFSVREKEIILSSAYSWDVSDLDARIQSARLNAGNINGDREILFPVYSNTYRIIQTGDFAPVVQNVVLLNIE